MTDIAAQRTADPEDQGVPEGLELHTNGTVTVHIDGGRLRLRRPKAGQYRALREAYESYLDQLTEATDRIQEQAIPVRERAAEASAAGERLSAEDRALDRKLGRELTHLGERLRVGWVRLAFNGEDLADLLPESFDGLATANLPDNDDDLPVWLTQGETIAALFEQWRTVPSPRGVR